MKPIKKSESIIDRIKEDEKELVEYFTNVYNTIMNNEQVSKILAYNTVEQLRLANSIKETANFIKTNPENQRRLTEVLQNENMLMQNLDNLNKRIIDMVKANKREEQANVNVKIELVMPKEEKIEDFIEVLPEENLE